MCFSAKIWADYRRYIKQFGAELDIREFVRLYFDRQQGAKVKTPKAMDDALLASAGPEFAELRELIAAHGSAQATAFEQELFAQLQRLNAAERALKAKATKKAGNEQRIATDKIARSRQRLADLRRTAPEDRDSRIFPGMFAPVLVEEGGRRWVRPMRYQCRPAGKPASYDTRYPGTYNARRDNLEGFWKGQFGHSHALMVVERFFENVERVDEDGTARNVVLEFRPEPAQDMWVACLWSRWEGKGEPPLLSFAAITDEPPPEVAAAGHDRCIVPIAPQNVDAWLRPESDTLAAMYAVLDERARPYYEHRLAA